MGDDSIDQHPAGTEQCKAAEIPEYVGAEFTRKKVRTYFEFELLDLRMDPPGIKIHFIRYRRAECQNSMNLRPRKTAALFY